MNTYSPIKINIKTELPDNILKTILKIDSHYIKDGYTVYKKIINDKIFYTLETSVIIDIPVIQLLLKNKDFYRVEPLSSDMFTLVFKVGDN